MSTTTPLSKRLRILVHIALVSAVVWYLHSKWDQIRALNPKWEYLLVSVGMAFIMLLFRGKVLQKLIGSAGGAVTWTRSVEDVSIATLGNSFLPTNLGTFYLVARLQKVLKGGLVQPALLQATASLVVVLVDCSLAFVGYFLASTHEPFIPLFFGGWVVAIFAAGFFARQGWIDKLPLPRPVRNISTTVKQTLEQGSAKAVFPYCLGESLSMVAIMYFIVLSFRPDLALGEVIFFTGIRNTSLLAAVTPGALGISEFILASAGKLLSLTPVQSVFIGILMRIAILIACSVCAGAALLIGWVRGQLVTPNHPLGAESP